MVLTTTALLENAERQRHNGGVCAAFSLPTPNGEIEVS
ncbi:hypothetical protein CEV31_0668 [Brucella thiophenivorans]|uniref:Uncharacterized protein n=1 Tax=Brucella thiophenivorans TaxID=571255 RepID=A0A256G202_9HYPH|nr:hypothetical protein CEV31_0668 [Brucella thiophenivorans]